MNLLKAILSLDASGAIGEGTKLAHHNKDDMKHFQRMTSGSIMVCGSGTLHQVKGLNGTKGREVILWREPRSEGTLDVPEGIKVLTRDEILTLQQLTSKPIIIIGGLGTYQAFGPWIKEVMCTHFFESNPRADTFLSLSETFPLIEESSLVGSTDEFNIVLWY